MSTEAAIAATKDLIGTELYCTEWIPITQDQIDKFADCTGDHQWIHVDRERSASGPFGTTIAHGFLTLSHLPFFINQMQSALTELFSGASMSVNYGLNKVRFLNPVREGSRIRDRIVLAAVEERPGNRIIVTTSHTVEIEGEDRPACVAELLLMAFL